MKLKILFVKSTQFNNFPTYIKCYTFNFFINIIIMIMMLYIYNSLHIKIYIYFLWTFYLFQAFGGILLSLRIS